MKKTAYRIEFRDDAGGFEWITSAIKFNKLKAEQTVKRLNKKKDGLLYRMRRVK